MRGARLPKTVVCVLTTITLCCFMFPALIFGFETQIDVAPNVLNIQSEGEVVTVHTDIAYSLVASADVYLNGVEIAWSKVDAQGNFVAKFLMYEIKNLYYEYPYSITLGYNTLTLTGFTVDGDSFIGAQEIKVIDITPQGK